MSRSRKHVPCGHYAARHRGMKRAFNKRVRRMGIDDVPSHSAYKRVNETWDDDDWRVVGTTLDSHRSSYLSRNPSASEAEVRYACYRRYLAK